MTVSVSKPHRKPTTRTRPGGTLLRRRVNPRTAIIARADIERIGKVIGVIAAAFGLYSAFDQIRRGPAERRAEAWKVVEETEGKRFSRRRIVALQQLVASKEPLAGAPLTNAWLYRARLDGANFNQARFDSAYMTGATAVRATFVEANLSNAVLDSVVLMGSHLDRADMHSSRLYAASLKGASLTDAHLVHANLTNADLRGADLHGARFDSASLQYTDFRGARHLSVESLPLGPPADSNLGYNHSLVGVFNVAGAKLDSGQDASLLSTRAAVCISSDSDWSALKRLAGVIDVLRFIQARHATILVGPVDASSAPFPGILGGSTGSRVHQSTKPKQDARRTPLFNSGTGGNWVDDSALAIRLESISGRCEMSADSLIEPKATSDNTK